MGQTITEPFVALQRIDHGRGRWQITRPSRMRQAVKGLGGRLQVRRLQYIQLHDALLCTTKFQGDRSGLMATIDDVQDDQYVARLLAEDAKAHSRRYAAQGLSALLPKRQAGASTSV